MNKPKILIELYGGLLNRVVSTVDTDIFLISGNKKELEKWEHQILASNEQEFEHITKKIISKEI
jgi:hypothetical protein